MALWEDCERRRLGMLTSIQQAETSLASGQGRRVATPEQVSALVSDVKHRGMARLAAEQNSR
jgi:hypothetical protein